MFICVLLPATICITAARVFQLESLSIKLERLKGFLNYVIQWTDKGDGIKLIERK